jgi:hypothetical protein
MRWDDDEVTILIDRLMKTWWDSHDKVMNVLVSISSRRHSFVTVKAAKHYLDTC